MAKKHFTVVRNSGYRGGEFNIRERHNERKNECYHNGDIILDRAHLNVHFHRNYNTDGTPKTYEQTFNRLLENGAIVKRGLQADAKVFDELIFDVNTAYFEENGGYEFAKKFFEEAYRLAVKEIGGEEYVLSAIMHADERNSALSNELGRNVFHYHLHVVYVPVVQKEILWSKRTKDKSLVGKVKEVIPQISHSKKWPVRVPVERDGKTIMLNSYSLLQDRFFEHMKAAGFDGFERGERGSTAEHLAVLEFKTKQEAERAAMLKKGNVLKQKESDRLDKKLAVKKKADADIDFLDSLGKKNLVGQITLTPEQLDTVRNFVKKEAKTQQKNSDLSRRNSKLSDEVCRLRQRLEGYEGKGFNDTMRYFKALQKSPVRLAAAVDDIMQQPPEKSESEHGRQHQKSRNESR